MSELVDAAALTSRFILAFIFLNAALPKLLAPRAFERAVANYALLPLMLVRPVARWLPRLELVCAGTLFVGAAPAIVSGVAGALLVVFACAVTANLLRGRLIECGCNGATAPSRISWFHVARDVALAAMAFLVAVRMPDRLSVLAWPRETEAAINTANALATLVIAGSAVIAGSIANEGLRVFRASRIFHAGVTART